MSILDDYDKSKPIDLSDISDHDREILEKILELLEAKEEKDS